MTVGGADGAREQGHRGRGQVPHRRPNCRLQRCVKRPESETDDTRQGRVSDAWEAWREAAVSSWATGAGASSRRCLTGSQPGCAISRCQTARDPCLTPCSQRVRREMENEHPSPFGNQSTRERNPGGQGMVGVRARSRYARPSACRAPSSHRGARQPSRVESRRALPGGEGPRAELQAGKRARARAGAPQLAQAARPKARSARRACAPPRPRARCGSAPSRCARAPRMSAKGLPRAWTELRASFGKAAGRLHTEKLPRRTDRSPPRARIAARRPSRRFRAQEPAAARAGSRASSYRCSGCISSARMRPRTEFPR